MNQTSNRARYFSYRAYALHDLLGGYLKAVVYIVRAKKNPVKRFCAHYKKQQFFFRRIDESALKEVLVQEEYIFLDTILKDQDNKSINILDIGANIGLFAIWGFSRRDNAHIFSVEANSRTYDVLKSNARLIQSKTRQWRHICAAAWSRNENINISDNADSMGNRVDNSGGQTVSGITFPRILEASGFSEVRLAKIDIEGAEEELICENPEVLEYIDNLVIELHPNRCDTDRVQNILSEYYPKREIIQGRTSLKPLILYSK